MRVVLTARLSRPLSTCAYRGTQCNLPINNLRAMHNRAVVFTQPGPPEKTARVVSFPSLPPPKAGTLNIRFILSPVNPSDINVIEGVYPLKPEPRSDLTGEGLGSSSEPVYIPGNEGLAMVHRIGEGVEGFEKDDWVVMAKSQAGTWSSELNVRESDVIRVPRVGGKRVSEAQAAMLMVNPPTAYNMLTDFVKLNRGDWVIQNGANSAVGEAVIQLAAYWGLKTLNFVRDRPNFEEVEKHLHTLGATHVLKYESLGDKETRKRVKELTDGANIQLALNCVSGPLTASLVSLLGKDAHLVSYGAMSKQAISLPTGPFIFKNLKCHGFWQSRWSEEKGRKERERLLADIVKIMLDGKLREPSHSYLAIGPDLDDNTATEKLRQALMKIVGGQYKRKVLLSFNLDKL